MAFDKTSGDELWRTKRQERTTWSTPLIVSVDGRPQAIVAGQPSRGYDLESGKEIWSCRGLTRNIIPSPIYDDGIVYLMSGFGGSALQAIKLAGAKGDVRDSDNLVWSHRRNTPYTPSGLVYGGFIYFLRVNSGVLSCFDAKTGEAQYEAQRLKPRTPPNQPLQRTC